MPSTLITRGHFWNSPPPTKPASTNIRMDPTHQKMKPSSSCYRYGSDGFTRVKRGGENRKRQGKESKGKAKTMVESNTKRPRFSSLTSLLASCEEVVVEFTDNKGKGKTTLQSNPKRTRFRSLTNVLALSSSSSEEKDEEEADIPDEGQGDQWTSKRRRFMSLTELLASSEEEGESKKRLKPSPLRQVPSDSNHPVVAHGGDDDGDLGVPVQVTDEASRTGHPDDYPVHHAEGTDIPRRMTADIDASSNTYYLDNTTYNSYVETATLPPMVEHGGLPFSYAVNTTHNQATQLNVTNNMHAVAARDHEREGDGAYRFSFCELLALGMTSDEGEDPNSAAVLERQKKLEEALMWECEDGDDICYVL